MFNVIPIFQWAFPSPDLGVRYIELEELFKHGSINEFLEELTRSCATGPTLQFASMFDLNCSTILSYSLLNEKDLSSFPSFDPNPLPFP